MIPTLIIIGLIVLGLGIVFFMKYLNLKELMDIVYKSKEELSKLLQMKKELLISLMEGITDESFTKTIEIAENNLIHEIDETLYKKKNKILLFLTDNNLINEKETNILKELSLVEDSIEGLKDFHNKQAYVYNESFYKKPFYWIFSLLKHKEIENLKANKAIEYQVLKKD